MFRRVITILAAVVLSFAPLDAQENSDSITIRVFGAAETTQVGDDCRADPNDIQAIADVVINVGAPRTCTVTGLDSNGDATPTTFFATTRDTMVVRVDSVVSIPNPDLGGASSTSVVYFTPTGPGYTTIIIEPQPIQSAMGVILQRTDPSTFTWMEYRTDIASFDVDAPGLWCVPGHERCLEALTGRNYQLCWYKFIGSSMAGKSDAACPFDTPVLGDEVVPEGGVPFQYEATRVG